MKLAQKQTGWEIQQIKDILVAHFGHGFNVAMTQEYLGHLIAIKENTIPLEKWMEKYKPEPCPICGKPAKGTREVRDGFRCEGGLKHYWRWRIEKVRTNMGDTQESGCSGSPSNTGEDTKLEHSESERAERVQGATPARLPSE